MFMFSLSAFKQLLNRVSVLFTWQPLFQESAAIVRRHHQADACLLLCRNASSSALICFFKVEHMPWGPPGMTLSVAPFTTFAHKSAESPIGTLCSASLTST